jgi:hypothetical protein
MVSDTGSPSRLIVRAATVAVLSFVLLLPANAQFWGAPAATAAAVQSLCAGSFQAIMRCF